MQGTIRPEGLKATVGPWELPSQLSALLEADAVDESDSVLPADAGASAESASGDESSRAFANAALRRIIGERLAAARRLNGFDQCTFSTHMGFANSSQPSLWEAGKRLPPLAELIEAARVLGVSLDYLAGESEEFERDPKLAARAAVFKRVERLLAFNVQVVGNTLLDACSSPAADEIRVAGFASRARELCDAVDRFKQLNSDTFNDLKGGAMLARTGRDMREALSRIERFLSRSAYGRAAAVARAGAMTQERARRAHADQPTT